MAAVSEHAEPVERRMEWLVVAATLYVATSLIANVLSVRAVKLGLAVDAGTLTYPLTFTLRDLVHKTGGRRMARVVIVVALAANLLLAGSIWVAARLPADPGVGPQREFGSVLGSTWRIVAASIVAQLLAELADTEVYHRYVVRFGTRRQFGRVLASNAVSIPLDSVLFTVIAFAGVFPSSTVTQIIVANVVVKGLASFLAWPMIYAVPEVDSTLA